MDSKVILKYSVTYALFIFSVVLLTLYSFLRNVNVSVVDFLLYASGYTACIMSGIYLLFKKPFLTHLANFCLGSLVSFGILLILTLISNSFLVFFRNNIFIFVFLDTALVALITLLSNYIQADRTKDLSIFGLLVFFFVETIIEKFGNWGFWFAFLQGKSTVLLNHSFFPPISILISIFLAIVILIYLIGLLTAPSNKN